MPENTHQSSVTEDYKVVVLDYLGDEYWLQGSISQIPEITKEPFSIAFLGTGPRQYNGTVSGTLTLSGVFDLVNNKALNILQTQAQQEGSVIIKVYIDQNNPNSYFGYHVKPAVLFIPTEAGEGDARIVKYEIACTLVTDDPWDPAWINGWGLLLGDL
jgi:hypothetical protein